MSYETADILDGAADIIERDGWIQGKLQSPEGVCAVGAIRRAGSCPEHQGVPLEWVRPVLQLLGGDIPAWNDAPERTKQEVLDTLRLAAKQERVEADAEVAS